MIKELTINDLERFNELGNLITNNFSKVNKLEDELNRSYTKIYGFYVDNLLVSFLQVNNIVDETDIINIVVDKEYRNKHIASGLLTYLFENNKSIKYNLEVRESNISAINLYRKFNFKEVGRRKGYYDGEDAIVMVRIDE